jgi:hypothetical protein
MRLVSMVLPFEYQPEYDSGESGGIGIYLAFYC